MASQPSSARIVLGLLEAIEHGLLEVTAPDGTRQRYGTSGVTATLHVHDWAFFTRLLRGGSVGVGESYMAGEWTSDDLVQLLRTVIANRSAISRVTVTAVPRIIADRLVHMARDNRRTRARSNIAAHYDLSNALYETFLDATMTYSSAVFTDEGQPLEDAQTNKYRMLAAAARVDASSHVLEIGCGWGGFAEYVASTYDCRVTGITLSQAQAEYARARMREAGLDGQVDIQIVDYRDVVGTYDRVVSIEMLEAVGHRHLGRYFGTLDGLLAPDGLAAIQVITIPEQRYANYRRRPDFIQRYIFPGGHLPSLEALTGALRRDSKLFVESVENIGMHYAETLRQWRTRFMTRVDEVCALGFDDRFIRMWEFYLAYCEAAFRARYINDLQLLLTRPSNPTLGHWPYHEEAR